MSDHNMHMLLVSIPSKMSISSFRGFKKILTFSHVRANRIIEKRVLPIDG